MLRVEGIKVIGKDLLLMSAMSRGNGFEFEAFTDFSLMVGLSVSRRSLSGKTCKALKIWIKGLV